MKLNLNNNIYISILISLGIIIFIYLFFSNESFFLWAFERHQNTLSWAIRPLLLVPFCYFSYKKNLNGILFTILALFTSMFWFSVPNEVNPQVLEFLNMEKEYLTSDLDITKVLYISLIIAFFTFLALAFWKKSIKFGIIIAISAAILKSFWSILMSPEAGKAVIPFAIGGFIALIVSIIIYKKFKFKK